MPNPTASKRISGLSDAHFSNVLGFNQQFGGYAALPWIFRTMLSMMSPREWTVLTYFYMRSGPDGISWATDREIGIDLGIGRKKLAPHIRRLEELGFIVTKRLGRNRYVKLVDPMLVAERQAARPDSMTTEQSQRLAQDLMLVRNVRRRSAESKGTDF